MTNLGDLLDRIKDGEQPCRRYRMSRDEIEDKAPKREPDAEQDTAAD